MEYVDISMYQMIVSSSVVSSAANNCKSALQEMNEEDFVESLKRMTAEPLPI